MSLAPIIAAFAVGLIALVLAIYFFAARGGRRTQAVFFLIVGLVLLVVAGALGWQNFSQTNPGGTAAPLVATPKGPVQVRILSALPVEPWVREAAKQFNAAKADPGRPADRSRGNRAGRAERAGQV